MYIQFGGIYVWIVFLLVVGAFVSGFALGAILIATTSKQSIKNKRHSAIDQRIRIVISDLNILFDEFSKNPDNCRIYTKITKAVLLLNDIRKNL